MSKTSDQNIPVQTIRYRRIKAAIWENQADNGPFYSVTITRSFKKDDVWHDSHSFNHDDLPLIAKLMYDAHSAIAALMANQKAETLPVNPPRRRTKA